jgi:hypothetical protein
MYEYATNQEKRNAFMKLWTQIAKERKIPVTELNQQSQAYILTNKEETGIGTIEFVPCSNLTDMTDDLIDISAETRIVENLNHSYQVRKMGITKEAKSKKAFLDLLKLAAIHAKDHQVQYYVSYLEKRHYDTLTDKFKFRIDIIGKEVMFNKKKCVPALIDVEDAINNTQGYPIHIKSIAYLVKGTKKVKSLFT